MATTLRPTLPSLSLPSPNSTFRRRLPALTIRCGPRDNRGPLVKGRILSIEAIHAVQSLKIAHNHRKSAVNDHQITNTLSRLIKSDLLAVLNELIRQNHCQLALTVFSVVRSEPSYAPDLAMYASFVRALANNDMAEEIDGLIEELEREVDGSGTSGALKWSNEKTLVKLIRALVDAERKESTFRVYGMMKMGGWGKEGSGVVVDEYVAKVLARGFTKFGEIELAEEISHLSPIIAKMGLLKPNTMFYKGGQRKFPAFISSCAANLSMKAGGFHENILNFGAKKPNL